MVPMVKNDQLISVFSLKNIWMSCSYLAVRQNQDLWEKKKYIFDSSIVLLTQIMISGNLFFVSLELHRSHLILFRAADMGLTQTVSMKQYVEIST